MTHKGGKSPGRRGSKNMRGKAAAAKCTRLTTNDIQAIQHAAGGFNAVADLCDLVVE